TAVLIRQQIYTLLVRTYEQARVAVRYLRRRQRDWDTIVPSLYAGRATKGVAKPARVSQATATGDVTAQQPAESLPLLGNDPAPPYLSPDDELRMARRPRSLQHLDERQALRARRHAERRRAQARPRRVLQVDPRHLQSPAARRQGLARPLRGRA